MKVSTFRQYFVTILIILIILPSAVFAENTENKQENPTFVEGSVHDPSVIQVGDTYYVFGSHLAAAKTKDFMEWEPVASEANRNNPLFDDVTEELKEVFEWAESDTLWAMDVTEINGKYYMYYNASKGDSPRSALGVAVADNVEGPYKDKGMILKSGMWDQASEDGKIYDANIHPNVVDPHTFYDADEKLWMVYGSYSGGIFILEMDEDTGLPYENQGYGKKLMGGNHSRMEGPYIQYVPETGYYYLHITFGGLAADGGYNMRVARSENPDGPYVDAEGNEMIDAHGPTGSFFDDEAIEPYGVKLMGNYEFNGLGSTVGYISPGHNSVYYDEETGEQLLLFHTRFPNRGEAHEIRVHQMFMNEDGWPVVAPYRYTAKEQEDVSENDIVGDYQFIDHGKDITDEVKKSIQITLNEDGTIVGEANGTWKIGDDNHITLDIDNDIYKGVLSQQWDEASENDVLTFTALSEKGVAVWGSKLIDLSTEEIIAYVKGNLTIGKVNGVVSDITLPTEGAYETEISWESSQPDVVSDEGVVNRPDSDRNVSVSLTATINKDDISDTKKFTVTVLPQEEGGIVAYYPFDGNLENTINQGDDGIITGDTIDSTGGSISFEDGKLGQAAFFDGSSGIRLPEGMIKSNQYSVSLWLHPRELTDYTTTFFGATSRESWISFVPKGHEDVKHQSMLWSGEDWYDAGLDMNLPVDEWTHIAFTVDKDELSVYVNGEKEYSGSDFPNIFTTSDAVFGLGVNYWDLPFEGLMDELLIYDNLVLSEEEIMQYFSDGAIPGMDGQGDDSSIDSSSTHLIWWIVSVSMVFIIVFIILVLLRKRKNRNS